MAFGKEKPIVTYRPILKSPLILSAMLASAMWLCMIAGCEEKLKEHPAAAFEKKPVVADTSLIRPEWWHENPVMADGKLSVCAMAEDADLRTARKKSVEAATRVFKDSSGVLPNEGETQVDSVRLPDGTFRAFVRVTAGIK